MGKRVAKQFSRAEIGWAARFYANPKNSCTYRELMQILDASKGTVYTVLYMAVKKHIVDDSVVDDMAKKALFNVNRLHEGKGKRQTEVNYNRLRGERDLYLRNFPAFQALQIIQMYADSEETQKEFRENEGISRELFNTIMLQYLVTDAVSEETFQKIMKKGVRDNYSEQAKVIWQVISEKRKSNLGQD